MIIGSEKPPLNELQHYGIRGMKWGVRRGGLVSRVKGASADNAFNREKILTRRIEGRSKGIDEKIASVADRALHLGSKTRMVKSDQKHMKRMQDRQRRIKNGEMTARDILSAIHHINYVDLVVSRRDNRG